MNPNNNLPGLVKVCMLTLAVLLAGNSIALPSDQQQPIYIQSDSAVSNEKKGLTTYSGKVEMKQGSLKILADKIIIQNKNNEVSKIIAIGKPAEYEQIPSPEKVPVVAKANRIEYSVDKETLNLLEDASLKQEGATMSGSKILYDMKASIAKAMGNTSSTQPQRIQVVIPPKSERQ